MVRKISNGEYLKRVDNMTAVERAEYLSRVGGWLSVDAQSLVKKGEVFEARLQNVLQVSVSWNDQECSAFEEGAVLLSALVGVADTKLPELLYAISAKRSIKRMVQLLREADLKPDKRITNADTHRSRIANPSEPSPDGSKRQSRAAKPSEPNPAEHKQLPLFGDGAVPVRPRHFDQYAHLLPQRTQERIAKYGPLMDELDISREKLRLLMNDSTATASDRAAWASKVAKIDKEIGEICREADREWEKVVQSGRVVVDDLGMARVLPSPASPDADAPGAAAGLGGETAEHSDADEGSELSSEEKAKRRSIRKWLTDTRNGNGNEEQRKKHVRKWKEHFREYLTLEGDAAYEDGKILEAAEHYGIELEEFKTTN